ncbi:hypothetical protein HOY82DRAFT_615613 [Tuber indicum]|nr:hypothetical protein HOY82DRAFT_615613 [Tuber indicum]
MAWLSCCRLAQSPRLYHSLQVVSHLEHTLHVLQQQICEAQTKRESMELRLKELLEIGQPKGLKGQTGSVEQREAERDGGGIPEAQPQSAASLLHGQNRISLRNQGRICLTSAMVEYTDIPRGYRIGLANRLEEIINDAIVGRDYQYRIYVEAGRLQASREHVARLIAEDTGK